MGLLPEAIQSRVKAAKPGAQKSLGKKKSHGEQAARKPNSP